MILTTTQRKQLRDLAEHYHRKGHSALEATEKAKADLFPQFVQTNAERLAMIYSGEKKEADMVAHLTNRGKNHKSKEYEDATVVEMAGSFMVYALRKKGVEA